MRPLAVSTTNGTSPNRFARHEDALTLFERSLETATNDYDRSNALGNIGSTHRKLGELDKARNALVKRIELSTSIGDLRGLRNSYGNLANIMSEMCHFDDAKIWHDKALSLSEALHDQGGQAIELLNIGVLNIRQDHAQAGIPYFERAAELFGEMGDKFYEGVALENAATTCAELGLFGDAVKLGTRALELFRETENASNRELLLSKSLNHWEERAEHAVRMKKTAAFR